MKPSFNRSRRKTVRVRWDRILRKYYIRQNDKTLYRSAAFKDWHWYWHWSGNAHRNMAIAAIEYFMMLELFCCTDGSSSKCLRQSPH